MGGLQPKLCSRCYVPWIRRFELIIFSSKLRTSSINKNLKKSTAVADPENFGGGGFKAKTSKIRMSSPKLRVIFRPKSEIQTFFSLKIRWSPKKKRKKKKKVFTEIETDFSAEIGNSNVFFAQNQVVSKK